MLLFLKCHKVSLEVILENQEKYSSACFAWSWKVSVPRKEPGKTRGKEREGVKLQSNYSRAALQILLSVRLLKKHCSGLLAGDISVCVDARRKSLLSHH